MQVSLSEKDYINVPLHNIMSILLQPNCTELKSTLQSLLHIVDGYINDQDEDKKTLCMSDVLEEEIILSYDEVPIFHCLYSIKTKNNKYSCLAGRLGGNSSVSHYQISVIKRLYVQRLLDRL